MKGSKRANLRGCVFAFCACMCSCLSLRQLDGIQASVHANSTRHVTMLIAATGFVLGKFAALRHAVVLAYYCYSHGVGIRIILDGSLGLAWAGSEPTGPTWCDTFGGHWDKVEEERRRDQKKHLLQYLWKASCFFGCKAFACVALRWNFLGVIGKAGPLLAKGLEIYNLDGLGRGNIPTGSM